MAMRFQSESTYIEIDGVRYSYHIGKVRLLEYLEHHSGKRSMKFLSSYLRLTPKTLKKYAVSLNEILREYGLEIQVTKETIGLFEVKK